MLKILIHTFEVIKNMETNPENKEDVITESKESSEITEVETVTKTTEESDKSKPISVIATEKIEKELANFTGDHKAKTISNYVADTLKRFCRANDKFAEVVTRTPRTLSDCCYEILKGCDMHFSDIDVYRAAVKFYFPNSDVLFHMQIRLTGDTPSEEEINRLTEHPAPVATVQRNNTVRTKSSSASSTNKKPADDTIHLSLFE